MKLLTCLILIASFAASYANPIQRVVGGEDAKLHEFPYQISIQVDGQHLCGGSILNENYVLTAAHCKVPEGTSTVTAGAHNFTSPNGKEQTRVIEKFISHEKYGGSVGPYDVALIKVSEPFVFDEAVQKISLPKKGEYPRHSAIISGWGSTSREFFPIYPDTLQKAVLPIFSEEKCFNLWQDALVYHTSNVCAGELDGSNSVCSGDSGGPLAQKVGKQNVVVGVVSWGNVPCGSANRPGVFTRVSYYVDWINENMKY